MNLQLLRNATLLLHVNGKQLLIDPMLAPKSSYPAFPMTGNELRNPLVELPVKPNELSELIARTDAVLLTHLHTDHWDEMAQQLIPQNIPIFCQPVDVDAIKQGFTQVQPINNNLEWNGIHLSRTGGQHGTGEIGKLMGTVSGFVIKYESNVVYIAGDTIWCDEVELAINEHQPTHIIVNGGAARFITGNPIVMNITDILTVCRYAPQAKVYVIHLEAVNHTTENREDIRLALCNNELNSQCFVPNDGEMLKLTTQPHTAV